MPKEPQAGLRKSQLVTLQSNCFNTKILKMFDNSQRGQGNTLIEGEQGEYSRLFTRNNNVKRQWINRSVSSNERKNHQSRIMN